MSNILKLFNKNGGIPSMADHTANMAKRRSEQSAGEVYHSGVNGIQAALSMPGRSPSPEKRDAHKKHKKDKKDKKHKKEKKHKKSRTAEEEGEYDDLPEVMEEENAAEAMEVEDDDDESKEWGGEEDEEDDDDDDDDDDEIHKLVEDDDLSKQVDLEVDSDEEDEEEDKELKAMLRDKRAAALDREFYVKKADRAEMAEDDDELADGLTEGELQIMAASQQASLRGMSKRKRRRYQAQANDRAVRAAEREQKRRQYAEMARVAKSLQGTVDLVMVRDVLTQEVQAIERAVKHASRAWDTPQMHDSVAYAQKNTLEMVCTEEVMAQMHSAIATALQTTLSLQRQSNSTKEMPISPYLEVLSTKNIQDGANMFYAMMDRLAGDFVRHVYQAPSVAALLKMLRNALYLEIDRVHVSVDPGYCALTGVAIPAGKHVHNMRLVLQDPTDPKNKRISYSFKVFGTRGFADSISMLWIIYRVPFFIHSVVEEWIDKQNYLAVPPPSITDAIGSFMYNEASIRFVGAHFRRLVLIVFRAMYYTSHVCPQGAE